MASVKVLDIVNVFTQAPMDLIIQEDCERTTMSFGLQKKVLYCQMNYQQL